MIFEVIKTNKPYSLNDASEQFYREVRKLEVRLDDYLKEEEIFLNALRTSIGEFKSLHTCIEKLGVNPETKEIFDSFDLKTKSEEAFGKAIALQGDAEHERSHLLESYGALISPCQKLEDKLTADDSGAKKSANSI